jgi:hypothetical protein
MRTRTVRHRHLPTVILAGLALLAAACSSSQTETAGGVASLTDDEITPTEPTGDEPSKVDAPEDPEEAFAAYEECMDDEGIDFGGSIVSYSGAEGLEVNADVTGVVVGDPAAGADPQQPSLELDDIDFDAFREAEAECSPLLSNASIGFEPDPQEQAAFEDAQLVFADCMEEHGVEVPDFFGGAVIGAITVEGDGTDFHAPDPQLDSGGFVSPDFDFEAFEAAADECRYAFDGLNTALTTGEAGQ